MDIRNAIDLLDIFLRTSTPAMLHGAPGVGKSDIVRAAGAKLDIPVIDFRAILRDPVDLRGIPSIDHEKGVAKWLPPSDLPNAGLHGEEGIFFMDEINAASPSVQAACFGLVLDRKIGEYTLPPGWKIVAAGNRQTDQAAAQKMPTPLANRFAHIDVDPTVDAFISHGMKTGKIHPLIMGFVRWMGDEALHNMKTTDLRAFPTPRSLERLSENLPLLDLKNDVGDAQNTGMLMRVSEAVCGTGWAGGFVGFVRTYNDLPKFEDIMKHPDSADVPNEPSARWAIMTALSARIKPDQFDAGMIYVGRIAPDFLQAFIFDVIRRDTVTPGKPFQQSKAYIKWASANMDKLTNVRL